MNKNVAIVVLGFLARKWYHFHLVEIFGEKKGSEMWEQYRKSGLSSYEFFASKLIETDQNAIIIYAQKLSLAPQNASEVNALFAMVSWPTRMLLNKLKSYLKNGLVKLDQDVVVHDFPCKNGYYTTPITGIGLDREGDVYVTGLYDDVEEIVAYPSKTCPNLVLELIQLIENKNNE